MQQHQYYVNDFVLQNATASPWVSATYRVFHLQYFSMVFLTVLGWMRDRKGKLCVSWRAIQVNPGELEAARVFFPSERFRCVLSHINLSWLILQKIWSSSLEFLWKWEGRTISPSSSLGVRVSVYWHYFEPREIAWHHLSFWLSRQGEFGTVRVCSEARFIHRMV